MNPSIPLYELHYKFNLRDHHFRTDDPSKKHPKVDFSGDMFIESDNNYKSDYSSKIASEINKMPNHSFLHINVDNHNDTKELKFDHKDFQKIELEQASKPPKLALDLELVVQNPGIYPLDSMKNLHKERLEYFHDLPQPEQIEFANLERFVNPAKDQNIKALVKKHNLKFASSTSGISPILSHIFYKLTNFKSPHFYNLSSAYSSEPLKFMMYQRKPASVILEKHKIAGVNKMPGYEYYSISQNKFFENRNEQILMLMGKYMEKLFTTAPDEFEKRYVKAKLDKKIKFTDDDLNDYYNFIAYDKILLRSQIDCGGKDSKGNDIVYEIKTRACAPIRYDLDNYQDYLDYEVTNLLGKHSSYEREFYDLIRGAFLKYFFQLKIGGMDGAFISFHNTRKIFGFEYITLKDMQRRIFGNSNFSDVVFKAGLKLLEEVLEHILKDFPDDDRLVIGMFANEWKGTLDVFVEQINENSYKELETTQYEHVQDYYYQTKYMPKVYKYTVMVAPILNNVITTFSPIYFEDNDNYNVRYQVIYSGKPTFDEYMKFMHEASKPDKLNIDNQYSGSWSLSYDKQ